MYRKSCLLILIVFSSCQQGYFEFDKIEHYHTNYSEKEIENLEGISDKNLLGLLWDDFPVPPIDKNFQMKVNGYYSLKSVIDTTENEKFRALFKSKILPTISENKCLPIFRDILIFKKNNKITGVSKICLECDMDITVNAHGNEVENALSDFDVLKAVLK